MGLREKVLAERLKRKWTQMELAEKVGVQSATISRIESGEEIDVKSSTLRGLAEAFEISVDYLIGISDTRKNDVSATLPPDVTSLIERYLELPVSEQDKINILVQLLYVAKIRNDMVLLGKKLRALEKVIKNLSAMKKSPENLPLALELNKLWKELMEGTETLRCRAEKSLDLIAPLIQVQLGMPANIVESGTDGVRKWYGSRYREEINRSFEGTDIRLDGNGYIINSKTGNPPTDEEIVEEYSKGLVA